MRTNNFTLQRLMNKGFELFSERVLAKFGDVEYTYRDVDFASNRLANALIQEGLKRGERIGILLYNSVEYLYCIFGSIKAGCAYVPMNMMLGDNVIAFLINDAKISLLFTDASVLERIEKLKPQCPTLKKVVAVGGQASKESISFENFQSKQSNERPAQNAKPVDEAATVYTGGTTGRSKGVAHSHQSLFYMGVAGAMGSTGDDTWVLMTPLAHVSVTALFSGIPLGDKFVIEKQFDPFRLLEIIEKDRITRLLVVPTILYLLLDIMKQKKYDLSSLNRVTYAASPMDPTRLKEALEVFGPILEQTYGQTEGTGLLTRLSKGDHLKAMKDPKYLKSCGRACLMVDLRIIDEHNNNVRPGEPGEICVQAPYIMKGYLGQPELTSQVIVDGWLHTGDIGKMDEDGYVYIVDRKKDMIISGGMNVYPAEVEKIIGNHSKVKQVAVIGVPDEKWGEAVTAIIVCVGQLGEDEIKEFCRGKLSKYAQPKNVVFKEQLPMTPLGKVDKKVLRAPYWQGKERAVA